MKKSFVAFKNKNRLDPVSVSDWNRALSSFEDGSKITVTVESFVRKKSLGQLGLVHKLFSLLARDLGYLPHQIKEFLKDEYGVKEEIIDIDGDPMVDESTGEIRVIAKSLADYTVEEMTTLITTVYEFAEENGIRLPKPDDLRNFNIPL